MTGGPQIDGALADDDMPVDACSLVTRLEAVGETLPELAFASIHSVSPRDGDLEAARDGQFRWGERRFPLAPPVDWWREPYELSDEWGFFANSFIFADPLLAHPGRAEVLDILAALFADWIRAHAAGGLATAHRYAWHDHAAAGRLVYMAFLLREAVRLQRTDRATRELLAAAVIEHARFVASETNYNPAHNHGLFSNAALALAARSLPMADQAPEWTSVAHDRMATMLGRMLSSDPDPVHLEHSPGYHMIVMAALARFADAGLFGSLDLSSRVEGMRRAAPWFVTPEDRVVALGDTSERTPAMAGLATVARELEGLHAFPAAGYAVVRHGGSYLIVTAGFHPTGHKHADDGSYCLYEDGAPIVTDSGDAGYDYSSRERAYCVSPAAHSTVSIDGFDWVRAGRAAYGSGLLAVTGDDALCAIATCNPVVSPDTDGGCARRLILYQPGGCLVVVDVVVEVRAEQTVTRHVQLAADLAASLKPSGVVSVARNGRRVARLIAFASAGASPAGIELVRGRQAPELGGLTFPSVREVAARTTVVLTSSGEVPARAYALLLDDRAAAPGLEVMPAEGGFDIDLAGLGDLDVLVQLRDRSLATHARADN